MDEVININVNKTKKETKDITKMVNGSIKKNGKANHHSERKLGHDGLKFYILSMCN